MRARSLTALVALVAVVPLAAACSGGAPAPSAKANSAATQPPANAQRLTVKGLDTMRFDPATLTIKAGQPVTLTFENDGQIIHDWTLSEGVPQRVQLLAQGKQQREATFTVDKAGTYTYVCLQPGHDAAGMKGTLIVE